MLSVGAPHDKPVSVNMVKLSRTDSLSIITSGSGAVSAATDAAASCDAAAAATGASADAADATISPAAVSSNVSTDSASAVTADGATVTPSHEGPLGQLSIQSSGLHAN